MLQEWFESLLFMSLYDLHVCWYLQAGNVDAMQSNISFRIIPKLLRALTISKQVKVL